MTNKPEETKKKNKTPSQSLGLFTKTSVNSLEAADDSILQIWLHNHLPAPKKKK